MIKPTTKQVFLLKIVLSTIIANAAGELLSLETYPATYSTEIGRWSPAVISTFFILLCIVIMQWILLSSYLPKWWVVMGCIGCVISAPLVQGAIRFLIPLEVYISNGAKLNSLNYFLVGLLATLPQWFLLKNKRGYLWVLANGTGWLFSAIYSTFYRSMDILPQIKGLTSVALIRTILSEANSIPLGLLLGLYLYTYIYNSKVLQTMEEGK